MTATMGFKSSSPAANALGAAMAFTVLLLWWTGVLPIADLRPGAGSFVWGGVDYGAILTGIVEVGFWPILAYLAARIGLELFRAWRPGARRTAALGTLVLAGLRLAGLLAQHLREPPQVRGPWIFRAVHAMTEARDLFLLRQLGADVLLGALGPGVLAEIEQHFHHFGIRAAMQRALQRADGADDGGVNARERGGRHARRELGRIELVIRVQDE